MAILKCKMCGGDLVIEPEVTVCECEYCGTKQTVPNTDDEKKIKLYERANRLRFRSEFDKAAGVYESLIEEYPEEAEAYWGNLLCKYGIEYVDDPATGDKVPTCHRSSFDSFMDDPDFEMVMENADAVARSVYREQAKQIEEIRKGIIEVSGKEQPYDIFICYKETDDNGERTLDSVLAQDVYDALTSKGYRVFFSRISLEDKLGTEYEPYIFAALNSAKVMLAFGTSYDYFNAVWVKNEWSRYLRLMEKDKTKHLIPCYKDIDAYDMPKEFAKLQAQDMGKIGASQDLLRGIGKIIGGGDIDKAIQTKEVARTAESTNSAQNYLKRGYMSLEDANFEEATDFFNKVLNNDPENAEAFLGLLMAEMQATGKETAEEEFVYGRYTDNRYWKRAKQTADEKLSLEFAEWEKKKNENQRRIQKLIPLAAETLQIRMGGDSNYPYYVGLRADGTVVATGVSNHGECNVGEWEEIISIDTGVYHTVGLRADGTVVATGENEYGECNVGEWEGIISIGTGDYHTVGLRADGTVVATGINENGECNVGDWKNIVSIATGPRHTVGLRADGTVVATGENEAGVCNVERWNNIISIVTGERYTVGLHADGTAVSTKTTKYEACFVEQWKNIVSVAVTGRVIVGLHADGKMTGCTESRDFGLIDENIVTIAVSKKNYIVFGLCADGTISNSDAGKNLIGWNSIIWITAVDDGMIGLRSDGKVYIFESSARKGILSSLSSWRLFTSMEELENAKRRKDKLKALSKVKESSLSESSANSSSSSGSIEDYIRTHFNSRTKLQAIKYYREKTGRRLKEAKEAVDKLI